MLVLCMYRATTRIMLEPAYGAVMIDVPSSAQIPKAFDYTMARRQEGLWCGERVKDWRLVAYRTASGAPRF